VPTVAVSIQMLQGDRWVVLVLSAAAVLAALSVGCRLESAQFPRDLPDDALVGFVIEGGFAGRSDYLVIRDSGKASLQSSSGSSEFTLDAGQLHSLRDLLEGAGIGEMDSDTSSTGADIPTQWVTYEGDTVRVESEIPDGLVPVLVELHKIIENHDSERRGAGKPPKAP
jgi:hypothetical protein